MVKVSELQGADLDYWVAHAIGFGNAHNTIYIRGDECRIENDIAGLFIYAPTEDGEACFKLIEEFNVDLNRDPDTKIVAAIVFTGEGGVVETGRGEGVNHRMAVCRAVVASVYGEEVDNAAL